MDDTTEREAVVGRIAGLGDLYDDKLCGILYLFNYLFIH